MNNGGVLKLPFEDEFEIGTGDADSSLPFRLCSGQGRMTDGKAFAFADGNLQNTENCQLPPVNFQFSQGAVPQ
jgi:hypothetical protein